MAANPMILHAGETLAVISCLLVVLKPQPCDLDQSAAFKETCDCFSFI